MAFLPLCWVCSLVSSKQHEQQERGSSHSVAYRFDSVTRCRFAYGSGIDSIGPLGCCQASQLAYFHSIKAVTLTTALSAPLFHPHQRGTLFGTHSPLSCHYRLYGWVMRGLGFKSGLRYHYFYRTFLIFFWLYSQKKRERSGLLFYGVFKLRIGEIYTPLSL